MILVDTSVWVEILNRRPALHIDDRDLMQFVICGPILQEVLQGLRRTAPEALRESLLALPRMGDPLTVPTFLHAAEIYRLGRWRGLTIRSATDCLIAAIAIENHVPVWHRDRDFRAIATYTALQTVQP